MSNALLSPTVIRALILQRIGLRLRERAAVLEQHGEEYCVRFRLPATAIDLKFPPYALTLTCDYFSDKYIEPELDRLFGPREV